MENIHIFDVKIQGLTVKEAMRQVIEYLNTDVLNTVEIMTMDMLMQGQDNADWKEKAAQLDLVLPGEREILDAVKIQDRILIRDVENSVFLKMFLKYFQKNHKKVFLLAEDEEEAAVLAEEMGRYHRGIVITGSFILPREEGQIENVINEINGTETDCLVSVLSSPWQEEFIAAQRALLNVRLWLGCGDTLRQIYKEKRTGGKVRKFFLKKVFRYKVEKEKKEN